MGEVLKESQKKKRSTYAYVENFDVNRRTLSDEIGNAVYTDRTPVVMPGVVEPAPAVVGRDGYPSFKYQDRFSMKNVENDESACLSFWIYEVWEMGQYCRIF